VALFIVPYSKCYIFYLNIKILLIIILTNNLFLPYRLHDFWYEVQKKSKEIYMRKRSSRLGRYGHLEGFQTSIHHRGYLESLYPTRNV